MNLLQMMGCPEMIMILRSVNIFQKYLGVTVFITNAFYLGKVMTAQDNI